MLTRRELIRGAGSSIALAGLSTGALAQIMAPRAGGDPVRLHFNENAAGSSPLAIEAMRSAMAEANLYPESREDDLTASLAAFHNLQEDTIIRTNGSTELLVMVFNYMKQPGLSAFAPALSFEVIGRMAGRSGVPYVEVPMRDDLSVDIEAIRAAAEAHDGPALVYLTSPNNPTGDLIHSDAINAWVREAADNIFFLIDEAYIEFVRDPSHVSAFGLVREGYKNLVVARTFSKVYGLAGVRIGFGVAEPETARLIANETTGSNVNVLGLAAGVAALGDTGFYTQSLASNARSRQITTGVLDELGLSYVPGDTNFIFHEITVPHGEYAPRMLEHGYRVGRAMGGLENRCRLSLGIPAEMERFAGTLLMFRQNGWV